MTLLRALVRRPVADSALVAHAVVVHLLIALLLRLIGLRRLTAWLACVSSISAAREPRGRRAEALCQMAEGAATTRVVWAVRTATHLLPAGRTCLTEALAAQHLLRWHGGAATLRLGVTKAADTVAAHAWLEAAGRVIIGGEIADQYQPMVARKDMP